MKELRIDSSWHRLSVDQVRMSRSPYMLLLLLVLATTDVRAQNDDDKRRLRPDSAKTDYEEWLRNEPQESLMHDSTALRPLPPSLPSASSEQLKPSHSKVNISIMTPALKTDMQLAYQSHWLEEQRKEQQRGAMMVGVSPMAIIGYVLSKLFPHRKSKKEREREKLQRILDNY